MIVLLCVRALVEYSEAKERVNHLASILDQAEQISVREAGEMLADEVLSGNEGSYVDSTEPKFLSSEVLDAAEKRLAELRGKVIESLEVTQTLRT